MTPNNTQEDLRKIWRQKNVPVLAQRSLTKELFVKLPGAEDSPHSRHQSRLWLRQASPKGHIPSWERRYSGWQVPKSWLTRLIEMLLKRYGECYVIQPYRPKKTCSTQCRNAVGLDCDCSCMGEYHGTGGPSAAWFVVSDTYAVQWGNEQLGCRHLFLKR